MHDSNTSCHVDEVEIHAVHYACVRGGDITGLVTYYSKPDNGFDYSTLYALKGPPAPEPVLQSPDLDHDAFRLRSVSRPHIIPFDGELAKFEGLYRIDDDRPGKNMSYLVWLPESDIERPNPSFVPGAVYGFYPNGEWDEQHEGEFPSSITRAELDAMMAEAGIEPLHSIEELPDPSPTSVLRVWDMAAMFRE